MDDGGLPAMASTALAELRKTAHLEGAAIIDMTRPDAASVLLFDAAPGVPDAIGSAHQMLRRSPDAYRFFDQLRQASHPRLAVDPASQVSSRRSRALAEGRRVRQRGMSVMPISPASGPAGDAGNSGA